MSTFLNQIKLVYGPFGQNNMHSTLDFCPRPARKEANVPLNKRNYGLTVLIKIDCAVAPGVSMKTERGRGSEFGLILRLECLGSAVAAA